MIKKAMILAAGFGKRLNPITLNKPKPLLNIGNETLLSNTINFLEKFEIKEIIINTHFLSKQIVNYVNKKKFNLKITIINEEEKILDTGGGIRNALKYFSESFLCINPDTIWNLNYINELKKMESKFLLSKKKCYLLVVNKAKSFDKNLQGDFNLQNDLINRESIKNFKYIYTGLQIINPEVFSNIDKKVFSINKIWNSLIEKNELNGLESNIEFLHASNLNVYQDLLKKIRC
jgi:N-acetyl-alpha-D-muramate 1-phosphate uridylyltransferase